MIRISTKSLNLGWWAGCLLAGMLVLGCKTSPRFGLTDGGSPTYDRAMVVYELNGFQRPLPLRESDVTPIVYEASELNNEAERLAVLWSSAKLSIQYPHPDGDPEMARATLQLSTQVPEVGFSSEEEGENRLFGVDLLSPRRFAATHPTANGSGSSVVRDDEIWVLDFPKHQLDLLLTDLATGGFFDEQLRSSSGTRLDVQVDRGRTQKDWSPEPRLEQFVARVYREGRLGGFVPCDKTGSRS